ncbi:hypothetical protein ACWGAE_29865, partial [Streptomyces griseus]
MTLRRLGFLPAFLLTACTAQSVEADDPKPTITGTTAPSGAPGGAPEGGGLTLADAIKKIPVAEKKRAGYERDSFRHWVDEDGGGCPTRQEVLIAEAVTAPEQGARQAVHRTGAGQDRGPAPADRGRRSGPDVLPGEQQPGARPGRVVHRRGAARHRAVITCPREGPRPARRFGA